MVLPDEAGGENRKGQVKVGGITASDRYVACLLILLNLSGSLVIRVASISKMNCVCEVLGA